MRPRGPRAASVRAHELQLVERGEGKVEQQPQSHLACLKVAHLLQFWKPVPGAKPEPPSPPPGPPGGATSCSLTPRPSTAATRTQMRCCGPWRRPSTPPSSARRGDLQLGPGCGSGRGSLQGEGEVQSASRLRREKGESEGLRWPRERAPPGGAAPRHRAPPNRTRPACLAGRRRLEAHCCGPLCLRAPCPQALDQGDVHA